MDAFLSAQHHHRKRGGVFAGLAGFPQKEITCLVDLASRIITSKRSCASRMPARTKSGAGTPRSNAEFGQNPAQQFGTRLRRHTPIERIKSYLSTS